MKRFNVPDNKPDCDKIMSVLTVNGFTVINIRADDTSVYLKLLCPFSATKLETLIGDHDYHIEAVNQTDYMAASEDLHKAYFDWKEKNQHVQHSVASFTAGWNSAKRLLEGLNGANPYAKN